MENAERYNYADFTLEQYRELLKLAKKNYQFRQYTHFDRNEAFVLWRHDVDFSMHAAKRMAQIEAEENVTATYFLHLHNEFYNLFERKISDYVKDILALGHQIGLHFDVHYYQVNTEHQLESLLLSEKRILEDLFGQKISVFSFHNTNDFTMNCKKWQYAGMINTYAEYFQQEVGYCSDSNGYWRFRRLKDVLEEVTDSSLQVLTHPGWWTEKPMSPRDKVSYCIDGRAKWLHQFYDELLAKMGRLNLK